MLQGVYERIRQSEFRPGSDHVTQVMKVQQTIVSKCPNLAVPYRRLVCYCRLYEVTDPNKKDRPGMWWHKLSLMDDQIIGQYFPGQHQREVFLFNDILVITKIHSRRKNSVTYTFRGSHNVSLTEGDSVIIRCKVTARTWPGVQVARWPGGQVAL